MCDPITAASIDAGTLLYPQTVAAAPRRREEPRLTLVKPSVGEPVDSEQFFVPQPRGFLARVADRLRQRRSHV